INVQDLWPWRYLCSREPDPCNGQTLRLLADAEWHVAICQLDRSRTALRFTPAESNVADTSFLVFAVGAEPPGVVEEEPSNESARAAIAEVKAMSGSALMALFESVARGDQ